MAANKPFHLKYDRNYSSTQFSIYQQRVKWENKKHDTESI